MATATTPVIEAGGLGKRYGRTTALADCTLRVPPGRIVGLVGPNGAGKSTLLGLTCGIVAPTTGSIEVLGNRPGGGAAQLARVGFVAQDAPVYRGLSVADHLRLGARLNPRWDRPLAERRVKRLGLDPAQKAGRLSGGQRAQLALTIAAAKRAELLILDEPVAALDPLARRAFLRDLLDFVAELGVSVVLSSHLLGDLEQVCDHLIVLAAGRVQLVGDVADLLAVHHRVAGPLPPSAERIHEDLVRCDAAVPGAQPVDLEDLGMAYMTRAAVASIGGAA
ncbi:ABC transporter ATP-binding protein [Micromonospora zhanjiangensis]|uniref:ABC transporter ATP-binding protein n=1 Tax=Micromonospora zhanjiangensis TaxID=1522057 RepID=A0ABV8KH30_9ACTN